MEGKKIGEKAKMEEGEKIGEKRKWRERKRKWRRMRIWGENTTANGIRWRRKRDSKER